MCVRVAQDLVENNSSLREHLQKLVKKIFKTVLESILSRKTIDSLKKFLLNTHLTCLRSVNKFKGIAL